MIQKKSDDAVSPVVGVMLMLVITIVIAGVIAAFGTGMVGNTEAAPNVVLDVQILTSFGALGDEHGSLIGPDFQIRHVSGDPLDTGDIEIQIAWSEDVDKDGTYTDHYSTYSAATFKNKYPNKLQPVANIGSDARSQPMYVKVNNVPDKPGEEYTYGSVNHNYYFGDVVLTPGLRLTASTDMLKMTSGKYEPCVGSPFMDVIFSNDMEVKTTNVLEDPGIMKYLPVGTPVEITILHIPSNTIIYEKEVVVQ